MTFFAILGIIAFFFICKFIYDSYLTNNTESRYEEFKRRNPNDNEVIAINKRDAELTFIDGYHKWKNGESIEALKLFQKAHELDPSNEQFKKVYQETALFLLDESQAQSNEKANPDFVALLKKVTEEA